MIHAISTESFKGFVRGLDLVHETVMNLATRL